MRTVVKKPAHLAAHQQGSVHTPTAQHIVGKAVITPRTAAASPHRQQIAQTTPKSNLVHKFSSQPAAAVKVEPLPMHTLPESGKSTLKHSKAPSKTSDLLEKALEAARGHTEAPYQHRLSPIKRLSKRLGVSGRATAIGTAVLAGLLLGGFYAYQNVPNLAMRMAASRAGFKAGMPSYAPSGFGFNGPVQYSSGQVVVNFKSRSDERFFHITQQATNWNSDSLLNNYVLASGKQYQTYQDRGRTIYIYDGSSATWVNGGVWYQIDGKSDLTSDQLVRIAASL